MAKFLECTALVSGEGAKISINGMPSVIQQSTRCECRRQVDGLVAQAVYGNGAGHGCRRRVELGYFFSYRIP